MPGPDMAATISGTTGIANLQCTNRGQEAEGVLACPCRVMWIAARGSVQRINGNEVAEADMKEHHQTIQRQTHKLRLCEGTLEDSMARTRGPQPARELGMQNSGAATVIQMILKLYYHDRSANASRRI